MASEDAQKNAQTILDMINRFGFDYKGVAEELTRGHRTLQQNVMRLLMAYVEIQSKQEFYDARNEATIKACKRLQEVIDSEGFYFPHI